MQSEVRQASNEARGAARSEKQTEVQRTLNEARDSRDAIHQKDKNVRPTPTHRILSPITICHQDDSRTMQHKCDTPYTRLAKESEVQRSPR